MNDATIKALVDEIAPLLTGRVIGRVFQLSRASLAIDFRAASSSYLFISVDPATGPRIYMIERRVRELEKQSLAPTPFLLTLRKQLAGAKLVALSKDEGDRIVRLSFSVPDALGNAHERTLVAQITGRAANLLLLDERGYVIDTLRHVKGEGQVAGDQFAPPAQASSRPSKNSFERGRFNSLSEAADDYYLRLEEARVFDARAASLRARLNKEVAQRARLKERLSQDMAAHGDAEEHKRVGDLLLANIATAERDGNKVRVTDYYAEGAPLVEVEIDKGSTLQEEAARRFTRYTKARRASREIAVRLEAIEKELKSLEAQRAEVERIIAARDTLALESLVAKPKHEKAGAQRGKKRAETVQGARRYFSSDGYEILVGRAARDNDNLTFRVARPYDLWLHAADYPGSHVIIRNPSRAEIPHRTLIEAAQLAANFSQARRDTKVTVHYTQRKFLAKPKGSAPGLVRMSSFRSITVEPGIPVNSE